MSEKNYTFKAEIKQLLDILIHSLYKEREIFLRELISNASDAITRLQFEMLTNSRVVDPEAELAIHLDVKKPEEGEDGDSWLIIKDSGIGMTGQEMRQNLGTIAQSGARDFIGKLKDQDEPADIGEVIGQFGVGFYSVFMAAKEVRVVSRSHKPQAKAAVWVSDGGDTYTVEAADKTDRGTEIHICLRDEAKEFADVWHLRQVVKKHSDFVSYPIYIDGEQANQQESLWRKNSSEVTEEDQNKFYQQMTMDFEPPLATVQFSSDAPLNLRSLLFVPSKREKTMFNKRQEPGVMLYSRNVMIQEYCNDLLPRWLSFVDGVVDSEDLPLNVSRETVQNTRIMRQLGKTIRRRLLRELKKLAGDGEKWGQFWKEYGRFFKESVVVEPEDKEDILPLLHFYTSKSDGELSSLDNYIERMPESQSEIYYVLGDDLSSIANSPHLDPFKARDLEVLYFVDPYDAFAAQALIDYKDKPIKNVDNADLELPEVEEKADEESAEDVEAVEEKLFDSLLERVKTVLGDRITEAKASKVLRGSPVRLVSPEDSPNSAASRINRIMDQDYQVPPKIIELNPKHALVANVANLLSNNPDAPLVDLSIEQLFDSALIQEGLHPNPADMIPRIQKLMELATKSND